METKPKEKRTDGAISTLFVRNLGPKVTSQALEQLFADVGPIRHCFVVADTANGKVKEDDPNFKNRGFGYVRFALVDDAKQALEQLNRKKFMDNTIEVSYAKSKAVRKGDESSQPPPKRQRREEVVEKKQHKKKQPAAQKTQHDARLIIRNLPWKYNEEGLQKVFSAHGSVKDVSLPRKSPGGPLRGFGFVEMASVEEAEKAMEALNGSKHHGRTIVVDWSIPKDKYQKMEQEEEDKESNQKGADDDEDEAMEDANEDDDEDDDDDEEKEKENMDVEQDEDDEDEVEDESEDESENDESDDQDEAKEESEEESEDDDAKAKKQPKAKGEKRYPDASSGTTLFVRNLLFETTDGDLKAKFQQWGPVIYARIARDRNTSLSRGTGFVCMRQKEDADKIIKEADAMRALVAKETDETTLSMREKKKKGLVYDSILTPEAGAAFSEKFTLDGRVLDVTLAVSADRAGQIKTDKANRLKKEDKRNTYLMNEGVVFPNTPAAETMTEGELQRRQQSYASRKRLINTDPALFISKVRLSIRNMPLTIDEKELRKLGIQAVQMFKNQVKAKEREDLSKEEKEEGWHRLPKVKQAKIVRAKDRVDTNGQLRSRGYGFLEFYEHSHALAALRYLNNNPSLFAGKRLIVEFSLENQNVIERKQLRRTADNKPSRSNGKKPQGGRPPKRDRPQQKGGRPQQNREKRQRK